MTNQEKIDLLYEAQEKLLEAIELLDGYVKKPMINTPNPTSLIT